jgi:hypothetical protein
VYQRHFVHFVFAENESRGKGWILTRKSLGGRANSKGCSRLQAPPSVKEETLPPFNGLSHFLGKAVFSNAG